DARRRAGARTGAGGGEEADIAGVEAIDVFFGRDSEEDALRVDLLRQRELDEDAVDFGAGVELAYQREELFGGDGSGRADGLVVNAEFVRGFGFAANVDLRCRVIADENDAQTGWAAGVGEDALNTGAALGFDLIADTITVENQWHDFRVAD